jgi:hypothetical protein
MRMALWERSAVGTAAANANGGDAPDAEQEPR